MTTNYRPEAPRRARDVRPFTDAELDALGQGARYCPRCDTVSMPPHDCRSPYAATIRRPAQPPPRSPAA